MKKAFTIIELLVVISIIAIFAMIIHSFIMNYQRSKKTGKVIGKNHFSEVVTTGFSGETWELK